VMNVVQSGTNILLQYTGTRSGFGNFVTGAVPTGATIVDDVANQRVLLIYASLNHPRVIIPTLNTNEVVVAVATPQQYGAVGDGITDDSSAFQAAMNAVYNSGGSGGQLRLLSEYIHPGRRHIAWRLAGLDERQRWFGWNNLQSLSRRGTDQRHAIHHFERFHRAQGREHLVSKPECHQYYGLSIFHRTRR